MTDRERQIGERVLKEIHERLRFLLDVGLDYLSLDRAAGSLSGGEAQRIRLATQIGAGLVGVLYVLDEPSIGLHQRDNHRLIETRSEEHTSELQSLAYLVCRLPLENKKTPGGSPPATWKRSSGTTSPPRRPSGRPPSPTRSCSPPCGTSPPGWRSSTATGTPRSLPSPYALPSSNTCRAPKSSARRPAR